ncbi:uncharacterized protein LOC111612873 [Centruroides sculpturatus]|uniref:uncharacterized protein LOC111612873 n=1 Tax=Centruroides sculpturatus TaxID=218467 RepID=UPI000C6E31C7|nr:uncharacterized protein LOC111612873 [Centruroides sculpturatus]
MAEAHASSEEKSVVVSPVNSIEVAEAIYGVTQNENMFKELVNVKNCNQLHVGSKIEFHLSESKASSSKKEDKERDAMLNSCCQMLKNKYKTYFSYMRSFLWEGKKKVFH